MQVLTDGVEYIKDENNPFYNQKKAENQGLSFFMIRKCSPYLLRILEEKGMLADAQAKSLAGEERSKAIVHENWGVPDAVAHLIDDDLQRDQGNVRGC